MMKAITLYQPWASLMAIGQKKIETRHWPTGYRGMLAIHAGAKYTPQYRELAQQWPYGETLRKCGLDPDRLPTAAVVGIVELVDVKLMTTDWLEETRQKALSGELPPYELSFGHYEVGRYGWVTSHVTRFAVPAPAKGAQGLWWWGGEGRG